MRRASRLVLPLRRCRGLVEDVTGDTFHSVLAEGRGKTWWPSSLQNFSRVCSATRGGRGFASKAEEFDIISVDSGLARIEGHDAGGFLVNNAYLEGSVICTGNLASLWSVNQLSAVTADSLALLLLMRPPPDLLVLGCGPKIQLPPAGLKEWLASQGVALECLDTGNAVSTFNILNQEGRTVVAALLPSP